MRNPRDLADRMRGRFERRKVDDGYLRETFTLPACGRVTKQRNG
ncbi:MAG: hypothetical protein ACTHM2_05165 [Afipia sp.]